MMEHGGTPNGLGFLIFQTLRQYINVVLSGPTHDSFGRLKHKPYVMFSKIKKEFIKEIKIWICMNLTVYKGMEVESQEINPANAHYDQVQKSPSHSWIVTQYVDDMCVSVAQQTVKISNTTDVTNIPTVLYHFTNGCRVCNLLLALGPGIRLHFHKDFDQHS